MSREAIGENSAILGSSEYLHHLEKQVFLQELPSYHSGEDYARSLREALEGIAKQLERDLERAARDNSYITDTTSMLLQDAIRKLEDCGVTGYASDDDIRRLAWFVGGDPGHILELQRRLNSLGCSSHLTEDGVYGQKTQSALEKSVSWIKDHLEGFLLNEDAVALVGFLVSLRLRGASVLLSTLSPPNGPPLP